MRSGRYGDFNVTLLTHLTSHDAIINVQYSQPLVSSQIQIREQSQHPETCLLIQHFIRPDASTAAAAVAVCPGGGNGKLLPHRLLQQSRQPADSPAADVPISKIDPNTAGLLLGSQSASRVPHAIARGLFTKN